MRLASTAHTSRPWLIHDLAPDFRLEDVWALPTPGGPDGFATLVSVLQDGDFQQDIPAAARALWWARWKLGGVLGWDRQNDGLGTRVRSLRERLPAELRAQAEARDAEEQAKNSRNGPNGPAAKSPFTFLYEVGNERAAEIANRTMHGIMHLSWVPDGEGGWRGQMAVLVKPNGRSGALYMAAIKPFRYAIVYPALLRSWERRWEHRWNMSASTSASRSASTSATAPTTASATNSASASAAPRESAHP